VLQFAGHRRTDLDLINAGSGDLAGHFLVDHIVVFTEDFTGLRVDHIFGQQATVQTAAHSLTGNIILAANVNAIVRAAIVLVDDDVLGNVHETTGEITSVRGTQGGISQAFSGTVRGNEVFEGSESLAEVRTDR